MLSIRTTLVTALIVFCGLALAPAQDAGKTKGDDNPPHWIWIDKAAQNETIYLRKTFELTGTVKAGLVGATCDNIATVYINGKQVLKQSDWSQAGQADVGKLLVTGRNVIA